MARILDENRANRPNRPKVYSLKQFNQKASELGLPPLIREPYVTPAQYYFKGHQGDFYDYWWLKQMLFGNGAYDNLLETYKLPADDIDY